MLTSKPGQSHERRMKAHTGHGQAVMCLPPSPFEVWFIRWFMCLVFALHMSPALLAAELQVGDGVVVKFGPDSRLVVRDRLLPSKSVVLTSRNDDTVGGQLQSQPRNPAVGDWAGVRFEKSMEALNVSLKDWQLRYAGAPLQMSAAALVIRGKSPVIQGLKIRDSLVGLQLTGGANPVVTGSGFLGNTVGVQVNGNSAPIFSDTQFVGNIQWAVENRTPATVVAATGNWWGDASGPRDEIDNPHGLGDPVTSGVNYGSYLTSPPQSNAGDNSPHSAITGWYSATYRQLSGNPNHVFATAQECMEETLSAWHVRYGSYPLCIMEIWVRASETQYNYAYSNCGGSGSSSCIAILECPVGTTLRGTVCEAPCAAGEERNPVSGQCEAPAQGCSVAAPVISQPVNGLVTVESSLTVAGSASIDSNVQILLNGQPYGAMVSVGEDGSFSLEVALENGANSIQAHAVKDCGSSSLSNTVNVQKNVPIAVPVGPTGLSAQSLAAGKIRLNWSRSADATVTGQRIYRADHDFSEIGEASMVANLNATATSFDNIPPADGSWTYRVVAVNAAGGISIPSNSATAVSDATLPKALSIIYESQGKFDAATERFGQGLINLTMTVNKVLSSVPYLAIVPENGLPIVVELVRMDDLHYSGSFVVDENTPSGVANAIFSARDMLDNRGTEIAVGGALKLDTEGPILSNITLNPEPPIKNDTAQALQVTFSFNKPPATTPNINYLLSKTGHMPVALGGLAKIDATTYSVTFTLPSSAGSGQPEILSFSQQTQDDLDNVSTSVLAFNHFQVYQGDLPPLDVPFALSAKAMPGGKVNLSWQTVVDADSYQIYRQSPEQNALEELAQFSGTEYIDQTPFDGLYRYAVASIRRANGEESRSAQSVVVEVETRADAPGAPQNLTLTLTGQGIYAAWQPPLASQVSYYNLYRASGLSINSIEGLTPIKTRVGSTQVYDTNPSPAASAYVVTAVDSVGNESAISNSAYLNASLLPVRNLRVELIDDMLPVISWQAPNSNVAGYVIDIGAESEKIRITPDPIKATSLTDSGYTTGERHYTIASVDAYSEEMPRSILLPNVTSQIISGLPLKRGIMNKLQIQVSNTSESSLAGMRAVVRLPTDKDGKVFKDHKSEVITLLANETRLIPVIVGGYADLPSAPQMEVGIEISPNDGELVKIARWHTVDVIDDLLFVRILPFEFTRRSTGKLKLMVENTSEVEVELLTATSTGRNASNEMRFKVLDADGNIQALQPYHQVFGAGVITLANGLTVARIPAGSSYVSDTFDLNIPGVRTDTIRVILEVDKLRYHSGQADEIQIAGRGSEVTVNLLETVYFGEITEISPVNSFGDEDIVIYGRSMNRATMEPVANSSLTLILDSQGFERSYDVKTDESGNFVYTFKPTVTDAGLYRVSAIHPDMTDRAIQKSFTINRVTVGPTPYKLDVPKNYQFSIPFTAKAGAGTSANNLRLVLDAASQPTGEIPEGISVKLPTPVMLREKQTLNLPVVFVASDEAQPSGALVFDVISDEHAGSPIGTLRVNYTLSESRPYLVPTPTFIETGMAQGEEQIESVTIRNNGVQEALNLRFSLTDRNGGAPGWASIAGMADGTLAVGESRVVGISFAPTAGTPEGIYEFRLRVNGDNIAEHVLNVFVSLTQSGQGGVLFKASDIYTATLGRDGKLIQGLAGATITLQNEDVSTVRFEARTDSVGEVLFQKVPAGRYQYRARAADHQEVTGRLTVKPGMTLNQPIFLDYNLITVEWNVREITIEDRYEIVLSLTFETDVPAPVVLLEPGAINLPKMAAGDVYYGELVLTNYGLIRADNLRQTLPQSDAWFRYEFMADLPDSIDAKQRITIPYRITALRSLDGDDEGGDASGGGCYSYSQCIKVACEYICTNGRLVKNPDSHACWYASDRSTCPSGSSGGGGGGGGGGGFGGGGWGSGSVASQPLPGTPPCTKCEDGQCCKQGPGSGRQ